MVRVAIAGGTGSIGLYISRAILATQKHALVVLSRRKSHPELRSLGADIVAVDFTDPSSLVSALQGVHTVISATGMDPPETFVSSQLALLDAAVKAGAKRFAPSEWAIATMPNEPIQAYIPKHTVAERVAQSGLEYTIFENGIFMDYFATGTEGIGQLKPLSFVVDVEKGEAVIPGKGDNKVVFTSAGDVAAFVAASLDLETWPERSSMAGDVLSYNQVVEIAERVRGTKFKRIYKQKTIDPNATHFMANFYTEVALEIAKGRLGYSPNLNKLCPEIRPVKVEEFVKKWWA